MSRYRVLSALPPVGQPLAGASPLGPAPVPFAAVAAGAVLRVLDALDHVALVFDASGRLRHESERLRLADVQAAWPTVARRAAREMVGGPAADLADGCPAAARSAPNIRTRAHELRVAAPDADLELRRVDLRPSDLGSGAPDRPDTVVVVLVRVTPIAADTTAALRAHYGLTPREAAVARLMAVGLTTPQIGRSLGVSAHTARHHGEHVFRKLGVRTRLALRTRLLELRAGGEPTVAGRAD